jgi:DNA uptake protein ComE-like DNA-binding protein
MIRFRILGAMAALAVTAALVVGVPASAQVGKGLVDFNTAPADELGKLPHLTPAIVKAIVAARPFASIVALNALVTKEGLTDAQRTELYRRAFVHVNLNTGTAEEFMLIPGAGKRFAHEFEEYRPWRNWAHFDKEIGKYIPTNKEQELDRFRGYLFIPININTATDDLFLTIPGVGPKMVHEFKEYRPWKSKAHFDKEIGKYINNNQKELDRMWRFMVIQ